MVSFSNGPCDRLSPVLVLDSELLSPNAREKFLLPCLDVSRQLVTFWSLWENRKL